MFVCLFIVASLDLLKLDWLRESLQLEPGQRIFIFEAERGGQNTIEDVGDICIDDVLVQEGECSAWRHNTQVSILTQYPWNPR